MSLEASPPNSRGKLSVSVNAFNVLRALICLQIMGRHLYICAPTYGIDIGFRGVWDFFFKELYAGSESFFVIAGFFLAYGFRPGNWKHLSLRSFFTRRFLRLILPFWAALALVLAGRYLRYYTFGIAATPDGDLASYPELISMAFCVHDIAGEGSFGVTFWFMSPLIQFLTIWGLTFWIIRRVYLARRTPNFHAKSLGLMVAFTVASFVASLLCNVLRAETRWILAYRAMFLALGCFSYWATVGMMSRVSLAGFCGAAMGAGIVSDYPQSFWAGATAFAIPPVLHWTGMPSYRLTRLLDRTGVLSYSVYLIHMNVGTRVLFIAEVCKGDWKGPAGFGLYLAANAVSVAAAWVFHRAIERPTTRWMKGIEYRSVNDIPEGQRKPGRSAVEDGREGPCGEYDRRSGTSAP